METANQGKGATASPGKGTTSLRPRAGKAPENREMAPLVSDAFAKVAVSNGSRWRNGGGPGAGVGLAVGAVCVGAEGAGRSEGTQGESAAPPDASAARDNNARLVSRGDSCCCSRGKNYEPFVVKMIAGRLDTSSPTWWFAEKDCRTRQDSTPQLDTLCVLVPERRPHWVCPEGLRRLGPCRISETETRAGGRRLWQRCLHQRNRLTRLHGPGRNPQQCACPVASGLDTIGDGSC